MSDSLSKRYRNISGTILVINDLNYLEIGINEVIDLSLFSDDFLNKSRGLRGQIALKNLIPDESNVQAKQIDQNILQIDQNFSVDLIKELASEVSKQITVENKKDDGLNLDLIKAIASEIGKEITQNIQQTNIDANTIRDILQDIENKNKIINNNNEYEKNIINSSIDRMQEALATKYPQVSQDPPLASEESFDGSDCYISDLKNLINNSGEKENA